MVNLVRDILSDPPVKIDQYRIDALGRLGARQLNEGKHIFKGTRSADVGTRCAAAATMASSDFFIEPFPPGDLTQQPFGLLLQRENVGADWGEALIGNELLFAQEFGPEFLFAGEDEFVFGGEVILMPSFLSTASTRSRKTLWSARAHRLRCSR